jgi:hypothetical protein
MKTFFVAFVLYIFCTAECLVAQTAFQWQTYFPGTAVDSILLLSTNKYQSTPLTEEDSLRMSTAALNKVAVFNAKVDRAFTEKEFPLHDFSDYLTIYELKKSIKKTEEVKRIVQLFPKDTCSTYPVSRCSPLYHDCVVFYKGGKAIAALKMCFSCFDVTSTKASYAAKCLANEEPLHKIIREWMVLGLLDLEERESR